MFDRFEEIRPSTLVRPVRTVLVALLAAVAGCDRGVAWRGVGTDASDRDRQPRPMSPSGSEQRWPQPLDRDPIAAPVWPWPVASLIVPSAWAWSCSAGDLDSCGTSTSGSATRRRPSRSTGPTVVQLERLQYLVSTRVHVADVLVGESRWLEGSWIIQGDALIGVDMSKAEVVDRDEKAHGPR